MRPRRKFASSEAPEPGQVWQWEGNDCVFYLVQRCDTRFARQGEMWDVINVTHGVTDQVFFNAEDKHIAWKRIS